MLHRRRRSGPGAAQCRRSVPIVYEAIGAPFLGSCFGPVRNCEVSQLTTIPANEFCEPPGAGRWHQLFSLFRLLTLIFEAARRVHRLLAARAAVSSMADGR